MRRTWLILTLLALSLCAALPAGASSTIVWSEDLGKSFKSAGESARPMMIDVWAVWCEPCKEMEETTFADTQVAQLASERFVTVKVDADLKQSFIERHAIEAYPTLLFLDDKGRELARREGLVGAKQLLPLAETIAAGYAGYLSATEGPASAAAARAVREYLVSLSSPEQAVDRCRTMGRAARRTAAEEEDAIRLELGLAQLAAGSTRGAAKTFASLAEAPPEIRGEALLGLVQAERARGRWLQADEALGRLEFEFPHLVPRLAEPFQRLAE